RLRRSAAERLRLPMNPELRVVLPRLDLDLGIVSHERVHSLSIEEALELVDHRWNQRLLERRVRHDEIDVLAVIDEREAVGHAGSESSRLHEIQQLFSQRGLAALGALIRELLESLVGFLEL